jgi:hypothetical protein
MKSDGVLADGACVEDGSIDTTLPEPLQGNRPGKRFFPLDTRRNLTWSVCARSVAGLQGRWSSIGQAMVRHSILIVQLLLRDFACLSLLFHIVWLLRDISDDGNYRLKSSVLLLIFVLKVSRLIIYLALKTFNTKLTITA